MGRPRKKALTPVEIEEAQPVVEERVFALEEVYQSEGDSYKTVPAVSQKGLFKVIFADKTVVFIFGIILALAISLGVAGYFYMQINALKQDPTQVAQQELDRVIAKVGVLMVLPNEKPTLATVSDPSKLQNQAFFVQAEAGDKVLIYAAAKKAILYSSRLNKILEVAPIGGTVATSTPPAPTPASVPVPVSTKVIKKK